MAPRRLLLPARSALRACDLICNREEVEASWRRVLRACLTRGLVALLKCYPRWECDDLRDVVISFCGLRPALEAGLRGLRAITSPGELVSYKCVGPICRLSAVKAKVCARYGCGELPLKAAHCFCSAVSHGQRISHQPLLSAYALWLCRADSSKERQEQARCQTWKLRCMSLGGDMSRKVAPRSVGFPLKSLRTSQQIRFQPSDFRL